MSSDQLPAPYATGENWTLYHGDCLAILPHLGKVDAVVTDPPYGINAPKMTLGKGKKKFHRGDWDAQAPSIVGLIDIAEHVCVWGGNYFSDQLPPTNDWLIWHKKNDGRSFSECEMAWSNLGRQTRHISHHWSGEVKQHPTMKPLPVMVWCVDWLPPQCTILDPFTGSGTTGVACIKTGRKFIGIEIDEKYCEIAANRLRKAEAEVHTHT